MSEEDQLSDRSRAAAERTQARREALIAAGERRREAMAAVRERRREAIEASRRRPSERRQTTSRSPRTALTLEAILAEAIRILDADGVDGLTLRRLAGELGAGVASVYWYVDDKDDLLQLACEATAGPPIHDLLARPIDPAHWREGLRTASLTFFEIIEAHPWVAEILNTQPRGSIVMVLWDRTGQLLTALGFSDETAFFAGSALMGVLGSAGMSALHEARSQDDRDTRLIRGAGELAALDPAEFPFITRTIPTYRQHSEREQFVGGLELILDGIASRLPVSSASAD